MIRRARALVPTALALLAACGGGGGGGGGGTTSPFTIVATDPAKDATNVALDSRVLVTFSLPVMASTVTPSTIQVGSPGNGVAPGTTAIVPDGTNRSLEWTPSAPMQSDVTHVVVLASSLRSAAGDPLGGETQFLFRTGGEVVIPPATALRELSDRMERGRRLHTATLLADATVLICGGFTQNGATTVSNRAELFRPIGEVFSLVAASQRKGRAGHTATRLADGRVLLVGGQTEISPGTLVTEASAEVYDPATGTFTDTGSMETARADHAALRLPDGRVVVTGGSTFVGGAPIDHDSCEVWDPATGTWSAWPTMNLFRATHAMVDLQDGRWLVVGGAFGDARSELMSVATGAFTLVAPASQDDDRFGVAAAQFSSGNVSVIGGDGVGDVLYFQRSASAMRNTGSGTTKARAYATATRIGATRILVAGGFDQQSGLVLASCDLVVEGGAAFSDTFATPVRFTLAVAQHTATTLADGRVLYAGGFQTSAGQPELDRAYLFTP